MPRKLIRKPEPSQQANVIVAGQTEASDLITVCAASRKNSHPERGIYAGYSLELKADRDEKKVKNEVSVAL